MSNELKPVRCGCGGEAIIGLKEWEDRKGNYHENSFVYCDNCSISTGGYLTEAEAVTAWNRAMGNRMELQTVKERTAKPEWWDGYSEKGWYKCACEKGVYQGQNYCSGCGARLEWE